MTYPPKITFCIPPDCDFVEPAQVEKAIVQVQPCRYPEPGQNFYITVNVAYRRDYPTRNTLAYAFTNTKEDADMVASVIKDMIYLRLKVI